MSRTVEYAVVTLIALVVVMVTIKPLVEGAARSLLTSATFIERSGSWNAANE